MNDKDLRQLLEDAREVVRAAVEDQASGEAGGIYDDDTGRLDDLEDLLERLTTALGDCI